MTDLDLSQLRQQVGELDKQILALIAQRLETTKSIGEIKQKQGLPIRDFRVEVDVLRRARERAREVGLDERVAEDIAEKLMTAAVQTQAELPSVVNAGPKKRVHIIGGHGRMGGWLTSFFASQGHKVTISDHSSGAFDDIKISLEEAAKTAEAFVLATNLSATGTVLRELLTKLDPQNSPLIFDIASLKADLVETVREAAAQGYRIASLHPMFAPGAVLLHGRAVLVCDAGHREATEEIMQLFADTALGLYEVTLEEHDKLMTVVLGLSHLTNLIFGRVVARSDFSFELLGKIASTTFSKQIKTAAEVADENPALYHEIQFHNTHTDRMLKDLELSLQEFSLAAKDPTGLRFEELMRSTHSYLDKDRTSP